MPALDVYEIIMVFFVQNFFEVRVHNVDFNLLNDSVHFFSQQQHMSLLLKNETFVPIVKTEKL